MKSSKNKPSSDEQQQTPTGAPQEESALEKKETPIPETATAAAEGKGKPSGRGGKTKTEPAPAKLAEASPIPVPTQKKGGNSIALFVSLAALALAAVAGWIGWQTGAQSAALESRLQAMATQDQAGIDAAIAKELQPVIRQQQNLTGQFEQQTGNIDSLKQQQKEENIRLAGRFGALETQIAVAEEQAVSLHKQYLEFARAREDRVLLEVGQAVVIASQQLQYAGNVEAALIALQGAQARLSQVDQMRTGTLRRALLNDIERLKAMAHLDINAEAVRLDGLLAGVENLPLAFEGRLGQTVEGAPLNLPGSAGAENTPSGDWIGGSVAFAGGLFRDVWQEVRGLIRVRRLDDGTEPVLLAPEQSAFLRENLKLRLLTARMALVGRLEGTFRNDIAQAKQMLERYFDSGNEGVKSVIGELTRLETITVAIPAVRLDSVVALHDIQRDGDISGAAQLVGKPQAQVEDAPDTAEEEPSEQTEDEETTPNDEPSAQD